MGYSAPRSHGLRSKAHCSLSANARQPLPVSTPGRLKVGNHGRSTNKKDGAVAPPLFGAVKLLVNSWLCDF